MFYSFQYKNGCLTASDHFHMFTRSIKFYTFHYYVLKSTGAIHEIDIENECLLLSVSFTAKLGLVLVLTLESHFVRGFILKPTERA